MLRIRVQPAIQALQVHAARQESKDNLEMWVHRDLKVSLVQPRIQVRLAPLALQGKQVQMALQ